MSVVLHISDTHFGTERDWSQQALQALIDAEQPDLLVLSGDITQRATAAQFAAARLWLDRLAVRDVLMLPGNHDIPLFALWMRAFAPYRRYRQGMRARLLAPQWRNETLCVIGVKTTRRWRHVDGQISRKQIVQVSAALREASPDALRIVVTHQPLWVDRERDRHNRCHGAEAALDAWCEAGADLFLSGHIHWPFVHELPQRTGHWIANAGTALSWRVRDGIPNSCNLIRYAHGGDRRSCVVERWDCPSPEQPFQCVSRQPLSLR